MGNLSNLFISSSYQSLIHLGSDSNATSTLVGLQDGLGNSIGIAVNTSGDLSLSGSFTSSLQQGYVLVGNAVGKTIAVATSSLGSTTDLTSLNAFSASQITKDSTLATYTGSVDTKFSTIGTQSGSWDNTSLNSFTQSVDTKFTAVGSSTASLNSYTQSNDTKWSTLGGLTGSYVTSAITGSSLVTASFSGNTLTFTKGNGTQFGVVIPDVSGSTIPAGTISGSSQITALGFVSSSVTGSSLITGSVNGNVLTFTKGDGSGFTLTVATGSGGGGTITTGSFATTGSNVFNGNQTISGSLFISGNINMLNGADIVTHHVRAEGSNGLELQTSAGTIIVAMGAGGGTQAAFVGAVTANSVSASTITGLGSPQAFSSSVDAKFATIGGLTGSFITESETGSFARTSSNNFVGTQTFSGSAVFTGSVTGNVVSASITANTASIDFSLGNYFAVTSSASPLRLNITNITPGTTSTLIISASVSSSISFSSNVAQPTGSAYSGSAGSIDILSFVAFNSSKVNVVSTKALI